LWRASYNEGNANAPAPGPVSLRELLSQLHSQQQIAPETALARSSGINLTPAKLRYHQPLGRRGRGRRAKLWPRGRSNFFFAGGGQ
jgi:hypothetical protein